VEIPTDKDSPHGVVFTGSRLLRWDGIGIGWYGYGCQPPRNSGTLRLRSPIATWPLINLVWVSHFVLFSFLPGTHRVYHDMCSSTEWASVGGYSGVQGVVVHF